MPDKPPPEAAAKRGIESKGLNRPKDGRPTGEQRGRQKAAAAAPAKPAPAPRPLTDAERASRARDEALGLAPNKRYEFRDAKGKMSYVDVGSSDVRFVDATGKVFLKVKHATMSEILVTTGYAIQEAAVKYETASKYHEALLTEYYAYFRRSDGNKLAESKLGSGKFWYELSRQHLSDSLANQLKHFFWKTGQKELGSLVAPLADANPGMECYGTAMLNVLKGRGLVPPSLTRAEFEVQYTSIFKGLPKTYRHHLLVGGGGGAAEAKDTLERLSTKLAKMDWASFTGMAGRTPVVKTFATKNSRETEAAIAKELQRGYAVFVHVPGHFKTAVGGEAGDLKYDDPLGSTGHVLYGGKPASYGVVVE